LKNIAGTCNARHRRAIKPHDKELTYRAMKKLNVTTGLVFGLFSLGPLFSHDWVAAAAFGTMGLGFGLSDLTFAPAMPYGFAAPSLPTWRRYSSMLLVCAAIVLFGYQIGQALHDAVN